MKPESIFASDAPTPIAPYAQATKANGFVFVTGQLSRDADSGEFVDGPFAEQLTLSIKNLKAVLEAAGCDLDDVMKLTIFMASEDNLDEMNRILGEFFPNPPARSSIGVSYLWKGASVMLDAIAVSD